jgi:hypothetical protein
VHLWPSKSLLENSYYLALENIHFVSFYYTGFTICERRNAVSNSYIDEWELIKHLPKPFFANSEPIIPLFGYTDSSSEECLKNEANLAESYGIDCLIFNHYFDGFKTEIEDPTKKFASSIDSPKFALNIVGRMPHRKLPFGNHLESIEPFVWMNDKSFEDYANYLVVNFLSKDNYFKVNNKALITFYHIDGFIQTYGIDNLKYRIKFLRKIALESSIDLHIIGLFSIAEEWKINKWDLNLLPFDGYSCYVGLPNFKSDIPVQSYNENSLYFEEIWKGSVGKFIKPIYPCIGAGWNASYRGHPAYEPARDGLQYPYFPIIIDDTPVNFYNYLMSVVKISIEQQKDKNKIIFLGPFNEWSESCYLLPDTKYGFAKLESIKKAKNYLANL